MIPSVLHPERKTMKQDDILLHFEEFLEEHGTRAFSLVTVFLEQEREKFVTDHAYDDDVKARQAWVSIVGRVLEGIIRKMLEKFCREKGVQITSDKALGNPSCNELKEVRQQVAVSFGEYTLLPDGDIILYRSSPCQVLVILSVKNSFRERYTETPFWKLKLKDNPATTHVRIFMITPDRDGEIAFLGGKNGPRKARKVMEAELDGIYLARESFDRSEKVKSIAELITDLERLLQEPTD